ncbi:MAG: chorismate synthase, partial [Anaerolineae bacterium]|nr:chorismate synthase [Anaerolineae bacterium]
MIRFLTAGESHGPMLTAILEGMPAGLPLSAEEINVELARRQQGYGSGGRMSIERDEVRITAGLMNGVTTGGPIALLVENRDFKNWKEKDVTPMSTPRPGHADLTGAIKYGYGDLRIALERASARETTMRVAVGAICRKLLAVFGIQIGGYVVQVGDVKVDVPLDVGYADRFRIAEDNDVRSPVAERVDAMHEAIRQIKIDKDTLGGIFEVVALNVPP